ncbi:hypothetical protein MMC22_010592 [Lobaria immixta]|nr:hypothetical protein [Lobaria immixta]
MTTSTRRRGWKSITDDEGEDDRSVPTRSIPGRATGDLLTSPKRRATWCTLITVLQRKGVAGLRMASAGYGQPVGNDQDGEVLPEGSNVALKRVIPRDDRRTGEIELGDERQLSAVTLEIRALCVAELRKHENIVTMIGLAWESRGSHATAWPTLILEYCDFNLSEYQQCSPQ